ncbi:class I SAM-dependent methyltransferase [Methanocaldococcus sp.]
MKYYDKIAKHYDNIYKEKFMREIEKRIITKEIKGLTLDIGCGTGEQLKLLDEAIGLDISLEMAKIAMKKTNKFVVVANAEKLPFKDNTFYNVISFFGALNHCNIDRAFKEIYRVLKPNGKFIFTVANVYSLSYIFKNIKNPKRLRLSFKKRKGEIRRYIDGERIKIKTRFYDYWEIKKLLEKNNFKIKYGFGARIFNNKLDLFLYKTFFKYFASYIGFVCIKEG